MPESGVAQKFFRPQNTHSLCVFLRPDVLGFGDRNPGLARPVRVIRGLG